MLFKMFTLAKKDLYLSFGRKNMGESKDFFQWVHKC